MLTQIYTAALVLMAGRAAFTADPVWRRVAAILILGLVMLAPLLVRELGATDTAIRYHGFVQAGSYILVGAYLLSWALKTRDQVWVRLTSAIFGLALLVPLLLSILIPVLIMHS